MKKLTIFLAIITATLFAQGCNDNFLNVNPKTEIGRENFFNSADDLDMYLNSLINWIGFSAMYIEQSDDATTSGNAEFMTIMRSDVTSRQITGGWNWNRLRDINYFLENFNNAELSQSILNHYEGVARFHRARFYMDMVQRFGDVPWYDKVLGTNDEDLFKPRDPREYVIDRIFEDYAFAAEHVRQSVPVGTVSNMAVRTFMARHALFEGTFRKYHDYLGLPHERFLQIARDQAKYVMDNGGFAIYSTGNPTVDYASLFASTDLQGNPEVILLNRSIDGERNSGWGSTGFGHFEQSHTKAMVQTYLMADGSYYSSQPGWQEKTFVEEFENRDPRLRQSFAYPGWILHNPSTVAQGTAGQPYIQQMSQNFTGYHTIKWFINNASASYRNSIDVPVLRYAEVLLTYAEARAELGELTQADLDMTINQLRDRAGMPHLSINPQVDPVQQVRYPNINSPVLLEIRRERRVELFNERHRFLDVMRYRAGHLFEELPTGIYFPGLGTYDMTGDGIPNVKLIPYTENIPQSEDRERNELGQMLIYYRAGPYGSDAQVWLEHVTHGVILARDDMGSFQDPKHYYRPIPDRHVQINPNLTQIFGWN
jgi:starch-binding outer membrane protein, SusD/RagB family